MTQTSLSGADLLQRIEALTAFSEDASCLTRTFLSTAHRAAADQLIKWMQDAGMHTRMDAVGNVIGRYEGKQDGLAALVIGSHYDTVRNAGAYDGLLGIVSGIACVQALNRQRKRLPFAIEVVGFSEEEGVRYGATLLGSRGFAGNFDTELLEKYDSNGVSMADAFSNYGLDPQNISSAARSPEEILAYVELHIEQGPVLLKRNLPVGVVTSIAGATRYQITIEGPGGHAGTVPMQGRSDALCAAAEVVLFVEQYCRQQQHCVGTVGQLEIRHGVGNTIPGRVEFSLDIRAGEDSVRATVLNDIQHALNNVCVQRGLHSSVIRTHEAAATHCDQTLIEQLESAIQANSVTPERLISGAGHDAMAVAPLAAVAMLFVRCGNDGISHHPDETVSAADAEVAMQVLQTFILNFKPLTDSRH